MLLATGTSRARRTPREPGDAVDVGHRDRAAPELQRRVEAEGRRRGSSWVPKKSPTVAYRWLPQAAASKSNVVSDPHSTLRASNT